MHRRSFLLSFLIFGTFIIGASSVYGDNLDVAVTTKTYGGAFSPRHVLAIWISNAQNQFVKSLKVCEQNYGYFLTNWRENSSSNKTDAITSASLLTHETHTVAWNCKDLQENIVPDGGYTLNVEFSEQNTTGKFASYNFTKSTQTQTLTFPDQAYFVNVSLMYTPTITVPTAPTITGPASLSSGSTGSAYTATFTASGTTPISWSVSGGTLPAGMTLNPSTGVYTGTPTTAGTYTFTVKATNTIGNNTKSCSHTIRTVAPNLALNKQATASSLEGAGYEAINVTDGNLSSRWASIGGVDPQWLSVDLGNTYSVDSIVLNWEASYAKTYKIQISGDGNSWIDAFSTTTGDGAIDNIHIAALSGRYVRMYGTQRETQWGYSLWEIAVYGTAATPAIQTPINVVGVVRDAVSKAALPGVIVNLITANLKDTTDALGQFSIVKDGASAIRISAPSLAYTNAENLVFSTEGFGTVKVDIFNTHGAIISVLSRRSVSKGTWRVIPGFLPQGMYFCIITAATKRLKSFKFISIGNQFRSELGLVGAPSGNSQNSKLSKQAASSAALAIVDILRFTKQGFSTKDSALVSYQANPMTILMSSQAVASMGGMSQIPAGAFNMGDAFGGGAADERPVHSVNVSAFYMDILETPYSRWDSVRTWANSHGYDLVAGNNEGSTHPVSVLDWYHAVKYCNARSEMEGRTPCYYTSSAQTTVYRSGNIDIEESWVKWKGNGYRLPTEAEWEKAARGGLDGNMFPWPSTSSTCSHDGSKANFCSSGDPWEVPGQCVGTSPCGYYNGSQVPAGVDMKNGFGLYDMAGNVTNWVWDHYSANWYSTTAGSAADNHGPSTGSTRLFRGNSIDDAACEDRCSWRYIGVVPTFLDVDFGVRTVIMP